MESPSAPRGVSRVAARARAHKVATAVIAVAGFLGLGGLLGQWGVGRIGDAIRGDSPPKGFNELYASWQDAARLNERLLSAGLGANRQLEEGTSFTGRATPSELGDDLQAIRSVRNDSSELAGHIRTIRTELTGPRADLLRLVTLMGAVAQRVEAGTKLTYARTGGRPFYGGSAGFAAYFSNELREDVSTHDQLVRQVAAGMSSTSRRFKRSTPTIRGLNRLAFPHAASDTPPY